MFEGPYANEMQSYYALRSTVVNPGTRQHDLCCLSDFDRYLKQFPRGDITERMVYGWTSQLSGKARTVNGKIIVIRKFLKYLSVSGVKVFLPELRKERDDYLPYIFSEDQILNIFHTADNLETPHCGERYMQLEFPMVLRLLYCCGLRVGEALHLKVKDVDLEYGTLLLTETKRDKHRLVPMTPALTEILRRYCMAMGLLGNPSGWLFPSTLGPHPINKDSVKWQFKKILKQCGITLPNRERYERGPCLHCLRHTFALRSFAQAERAGRPIDDSVPFLSTYMGHDSLNETATYLKFTHELYPEDIDTFGDYIDDLIPEINYEHLEFEED